MDHGDGIDLEVWHGFEGVDFFLLAVPINNLPINKKHPSLNNSRALYLTFFTHIFSLSMVQITPPLMFIFLYLTHIIIQHTLL